MTVGQCKTDPVAGIAGDLYNTLTGDGDNGLAASALVSGSTARKLLGALLGAVATAIDGAGAAPSLLGPFAFTQPSGTLYASPGDWNGNSLEMQWAVPFACTVDRLYVHARASGAAGDNVVTLRKGGGDQAVTATLTAGTTDASDTTNSVAFAQGDLMSIKSVQTGGPMNVPRDLQVTLRIRPA